MKGKNAGNEDTEPKQGTKTWKQDRGRKRGTKIGNEDGEQRKETETVNQEREPSLRTKTNNEECEMQKDKDGEKREKSLPIIHFCFHLKKLTNEKTTQFPKWLCRFENGFNGSRGGVGCCIRRLNCYSLYA